MQENLNRDSVEDRARDLYKWTKSILKNDQYRVSYNTVQRNFLWMNIFKLKNHIQNISII